MPDLGTPEGSFVTLDETAVLGWRWWAAGRQIDRTGRYVDGDRSWKLRGPWARGWEWPMPETPGAAVTSECSRCGLRCDIASDSAHLYAWKTPDILWSPGTGKIPTYRFTARALFFMARGRVRLLDRVQQGTSSWSRGEVRSQVAAVEEIVIPDNFKEDWALGRIVAGLERYGPVTVLPREEFWPGETRAFNDFHFAIERATVQVPA